MSKIVLKELIYSIILDNFKDFKTIIKQLGKDLDTLIIEEKNNNNLIHFLCDNNKPKLLEYVIKVFPEINNLNNFESIHRISKWIDKKNSKGMTPLFFAVYIGNMDLIMILERYGANIFT